MQLYPPLLSASIHHFPIQLSNTNVLLMIACYHSFPIIERTHLTVQIMKHICIAYLSDNILKIILFITY